MESRFRFALGEKVESVILTMAGVGKLLKQAAKMQKEMEEVQRSLQAREITVSTGGGAVAVTISGQGDFKAITIDPEFLREEAGLVSETLLEAVREAQQKAKAASEAAMGAVTQGMSLPGLF